MPDQRDIVLVPIPFTDLTSKRRRPVVVISNDKHNHNTDAVVLVAMTSNLKAADYSFTITSADLAIGSPSSGRAESEWTGSTRWPSPS